MKELTDQILIQNKLNELTTNPLYILVIDGITLAAALHYHEKFFFQAAIRTAGVVCCRCSPI